MVNAHFNLPVMIKVMMTASMLPVMRHETALIKLR